MQEGECGALPRCSRPMMFDRLCRPRRGSPMYYRHRLGVLTAASLFALSVSAGAVLAAGEPDPKPSNPPAKSSGDKVKSGQKKKKDQKSEQEFRDGYRAAYALVQAGDYQAAFAAFKALDQDD